jgi:RimJ/RimL family protein N-acetyltransferase
MSVDNAHAADGMIPRMGDDLAPRLEGELVVLEPLHRGHLDALFEAAQPLEIWEFWPFNPASDRRRFEEWLDDVLRAVASGTEARFVTLDAHTERPIGSTSFCTLRPEHGGLEIGWTWLTPSAWRTGANAEAKLLQLRHAFSQLGCQRVEFETDELNVRSRRALEALPAQFEGVLRDLKLLADGRRRSSAVYSILAREWPVVEERLQHRVREAVHRRSL